MFDIINNARRWSKEILKSYRRCNHLWRVNEMLDKANMPYRKNNFVFTLMSAQHLVSVLLGFKDWSDFLHNFYKADVDNLIQYKNNPLKEVKLCEKEDALDVEENALDILGVPVELL